VSPFLWGGEGGKAGRQVRIWLVRDMRIFCFFPQRIGIAGDTGLAGLLRGKESDVTRA
jgi:hypothetical protein